MIISFCLNPQCSQPKNHPKLTRCYACGSKLILRRKYRAIKVLGKGGFGTTFIGVDLTARKGQLCVIKQLRPNTDDPQAIRTAISLFEREANIMRQINHPQIPQLLDYFEEKGQFYLIQQLVNGQNLQKEVKKKGVYGELAVRRFLEESAPILKYIHSQKIIHRDIKPANILRRKKDGKLILIDFGAVKDQVNTQLAKTYGQTELTKFSVGTVGYAPPEQLAMRPIYASDIYALGATCLYLLTGKSPKKFSVETETGNLIWQPEVAIGSSLAKILEKMLASNIRERYRKIDQLIDDLNIQTLESNLTKLSNSYSANSELDYKSTYSTDFTLHDLSSTQISNTMSPTQSLKQAIAKRRYGKQYKAQFFKWDENKFFNACESGKTDYSEQDLSGLNLENSRLNNYSFRYAKLQGVSFINANLAQANFYAADLTSASLKKANLANTYFYKTNLINADLKGANLTNADFTHAKLSGANLCGANLKHARVDDKQLSKAKVNWKTIFPDGRKRWWKFF